MSEILTGVVVGTIYGTFADATAYIGSRLGDHYSAWRDLPSDDDRKRALVSAADYLDQLTWREGYKTFAERDAVSAIQWASYELAALGAEDVAVFAVLSIGSNIESVHAGGAGVSYFDPLPAGIETAGLPSILRRLLSAYLASEPSSGTVGGFGQSGSACNPFADYSGDSCWWKS